MSLRLLKYVASKGGAVEKQELIKSRDEWNKSYGIQQNFEDILDELKEQGLVDYNFSTRNVELTEKGREVSAILLEKKGPIFEVHNTEQE